MRGFVWCVVVVGLLFSGCIFNEDKKEGAAVYSAEEYFPIIAGEVKEFKILTIVPLYRTKYGDFEDWEIIEYEKWEIINDLTKPYTYKCNTYTGEGVFPDIEYSEKYDWNGFQYRITDNKVYMGFVNWQFGGLVADFDVPLGEAVTIKSAKDSDDNSDILLNQKTISDNDIIVVPAGVFENCIHIHTISVSYDDGVPDIEYEDYWFAKDVGLVKQISTRNIDAYIVTRELVSNTP